jgi:flagellar hook-associated protein 1 FlgK
MSGLVSSLNQAVRALTAQSRGVETAGRNLANVNNPDYARQRVLFGDRGTVLTPQGAQSLGIEAKATQQIRDLLLDRQLAREIARVSSLDAESSAYAKTQAALGESIDRTQSADSVAASGQGLAAVVTEFFNAFQAFAARPTDLGERQNLVQRAEILAERFRLTDSRLGQLQADLGTQVEADLDDSTRLLATIADLNGQIGRFEINAPGSAADLRDQRQAAIEQLAGKIGAETRPSATEAGQVDVFVRDAGGTPILLVDRATLPAALTYDGVQLLAGGTPVAMSGGSIQGHLTARDGAVQDLRDRLDVFAGQLAASVNAAYNPTNATGDFFDYNPAAPASTLTLTAGLTPVTLKASDGGAPADNTLALAVSGLTSRVFSTAGGDLLDGTFSQYYSGVVSDLGRVVAGAEGRLRDQTSIETLVRQQRQSVSGVSLDEEMTDLMKFQRAFQASSRVINVVDELLDVVVNRLIR